MIRRPTPAVVLTAAVLAMAACSSAAPTGNPPTTAGTQSSASSVPPSPPTIGSSTGLYTSGAGPTSQPVPETSWSTAPYAKAFAGKVPPVPMTVAVRTAAHPEGGYDRIAVEFSKGLPGYSVKYVPRVVRDASGLPVTMPGAAYLQIVFAPAQAHDAGGMPMMHPVPTDPQPVGYPAMRAYMMSGDFEGRVSIALGLRAATGFRTGDFVNAVGDHVVYVDVRQ
jgi:hypothetical protein